MRTAPGGKRPQRVAYDPSSLIAARGAVSSYVYGVGLGLVACIIPALIIAVLSPGSRAPHEEGSAQVENPLPALRSTDLHEVVMTDASTECTSAGSDRSLQETREEAGNRQQSCGDAVCVGADLRSPRAGEMASGRAEGRLEPRQTFV